MRSLLIIILVPIFSSAFGQTNPEKELNLLSKDMFRWEVENKIDSLANLFDERLLVVSSKGEIRNKSEYLSTFTSGTIVHNSIEVEESVAKIAGNFATVAGKGRFSITRSGIRSSIHLSYAKIFIQVKEKWKLLALHASIIPD
jgi:hypothetical protein